MERRQNTKTEAKNEPIVLIEWADACSHSQSAGFDNPELQQLSNHYLVGYLISKNKKTTVVGNDIGVKDNLYREIIVIPSSNVISLKRLKQL